MGAKSPIGRIGYRDEPDVHAHPVKPAWKRLKQWSMTHLPQNAQSDCPPASDRDIQNFEAAIGAKLPKDVRDSYRVYNGQCGGPGIIYGLAVLSLQDSLHQWKTWVRVHKDNLKQGFASQFDEACSSFPAEFVRPVYFDPGWVPMTYDGSGNHIGVDLNPGPNGKRGQVIVFGRDDEFHPVLALSWGQFLSDLADELEAGNFRLDTTDSKYPEFHPDDPYKKHFHSIGIHWSRGKLGLHRLSTTDQRRWNKWHGK